MQDGGAYFFRLAVARNGDKSQLVLERTIPDPAATENPGFTDAEHSVLAEDIAELRISYFGRDANAADADTPSWRDKWDDRQRLPLLMRIVKDQLDFKDLVSRVLTFDYVGALAASVLFPIFCVPRLGLVRTSLLFVRQFFLTPKDGPLSKSRAAMPMQPRSEPTPVPPKPRRRLE